MKLVYEINQFHFFTNNSDVSVTPEVVSKILGEFLEFGLIPTFGQEINAINSGKRQFLIMTSPDEKMRIEFLSPEIIISFNNIGSDGFLHKLNDFVDKIFKIFPDKIGNRVSLVNSRFYRSTEDDYKKIYNELFTYHKVEPVEWDNRIVERKEISDGEIINSISTIRRCRVHGPFTADDDNKDCILFEIDSNTIPENKTNRFEFSKLEKILVELSDNNVKIRTELNRYTS